MDTLILSPFTPWVLIGVGIAFIAFEIIVTSFVIIWFGLGLICTGLLTYMITFDDGMWQLALSSLIAIVMMYLLRTKVINNFINSKETIDEDFLNESGIGIILNGKVKYKATYWDVEQVDGFELVDGMKVYVLSTYNGIAKIKKDK